MTKITAILCVYKRIHNLQRQIQELANSSRPIDEYIIWNNSNEQIVIDPPILADVKIINSSENLGVRPRFSIGLHAKGDYIFVVDDDVIPGKLWLEKCLKACETIPGIYGSRGSVFRSMEERRNREIVDHNSTYDYQKEVDMSGRSWFFPKQVLNAMFFEPAPDYPTCGEELWVSYMARKHLGMSTWIPPHTEEIESRGNKEPDLGIDQVANYNSQKDKYQEFYIKAIEHGFRPLLFKSVTGIYIPHG